MTNRTWTNGGTDSFNDPAAWTPDGTPDQCSGPAVWAVTCARDIDPEGMRA